jgi:hypothetical protein
MNASLAFLILAAAQQGPDFDGDGHGDLPIGVPNEDSQALHDVGAVNVLYGRGGSVGLHALSNQLLALAAPYWSGQAAAAYDVFGSAMAWGDFDGDGYDDLAIGAPQEAIGSLSGAGAVNVIFTFTLSSSQFTS